MNYGKALKVARAIAGLQQKELAAKAGLDPSHISLIEKGTRKPSLDTVGRICQALGIPDHLFTLLATEAKDMHRIEQGELARVAESLARFMVGRETRHTPQTKRRRKDAA